MRDLAGDDRHDDSHAANAGEAAEDLFVEGDAVEYLSQGLALIPPVGGPFNSPVVAVNQYEHVAPQIGLRVSRVMPTLPRLSRIANPNYRESPRVTLFQILVLRH
jgi:hypothetical protein